jgi:hypothetical protein
MQLLQTWKVSQSHKVALDVTAAIEIQLFEMLRLLHR